MAKQAYIIGLTGNIASGKSVVRQMLQNYGALTIDADMLARRTYDPETLAYDEIITVFGTEILDQKGQIDRQVLGKIVFSNTEKLKTLEGIVHPHTLEALELVLHNATTPIIVLEMIKLFEIGLEGLCDTVWVCTASDLIRMQRLVDERNLTMSEALIRINAQTPQQDLVKRADHVIDTNGSFTHTWEQVDAHLRQLAIVPASPYKNHPVGNALTARQLSFYEVVECAEWLSGINKHTIHVEEIFKTLGMQSMLALRKNNQMVGLIHWKISNFITLVTTFLLQAGIAPLKTRRLLKYFEMTANRHLCEVLCISSATELSMDSQKRYEYIMPEMIKNPAWQSMVNRLTPQNIPVYFRPLKMNGRIVPIQGK